MQPKTPPAGKSCSNILPAVVAALLGASMVAACERPDARDAAAENYARTASTGAPAREPLAESANAAPASQPRAMPSREAISDSVITARVKTAMLADPGMAGADISVNTDRGVVSLAGTVKSHEQAGIASAHAQRQDGVVRVDNHIAMTPQ
jgi:hyperosmotically inducible protein